MGGAVAELLVVLVVVGAGIGVIRSLGRRPTPPAPPRWEPHVSAVDNHTVVSVRRAAARPGGRDESLEIARFAADDPDWQSKLVAARAEATTRAIYLNGPADSS